MIDLKQQILFIAIMALGSYCIVKPIQPKLKEKCSVAQNVETAKTALPF